MPEWDERERERRGGEGGSEWDERERERRGGEVVVDRSFSHFWVGQRKDDEKQSKDKKEERAAEVASIKRL